MFVSILENLPTYIYSGINVASPLIFSLILLLLLLPTALWDCFSFGWLRLWLLFGVKSGPGGGWEKCGYRGIDVVRGQSANWGVGDWIRPRQKRRGRRLRLHVLMWFEGSKITSKQSNTNKQRFSQLVKTWRKNEQIKNLLRCCEQKNALDQSNLVPYPQATSCSFPALVLSSLCR